MTATSSTPAVSIVIPTYGHRDYVLLTLESVFAQTFSDYEVIVVNDGSPDDTADLLRPLAEAGRIRYLEQTNAGQASARNRGLAESRGEFIALLDDDDLWPAEKLAWQVEALRQHPEVAVVYGKPRLIDRSGRRFVPLDRQGKPVPYPVTGSSGNVHGEWMKCGGMVSPGQSLIRRGALAMVGDVPFDPAIWGCDDWDFWLRLAERGAFLFIDTVALCYRLHEDNASRDGFRMHRNMLVVYQKHLQRNREDPERLDYTARNYHEFRKKLPGWWLAQAYMDFCAGDARSAFPKILAVLRLGPRYLLNKDLLRFLLNSGRKALCNNRRAHARILR